MILRPVSPQSPDRAADDEPAGGVDVILGALVDPFGRQHGLQDLLHDRFAQVPGADIVRMLGGEHHRLETHRLVVLVAQGDLALGVGAQPGELAVLAHLGLALHQAVRERDGGRHQHVGLVGRVAEHQALVAGALLALVLAVHALGDVGGLLADDVEHAAARAVEAHVGGVVADVEHGLAHQRFHVDPGAGGDLAGHDHHTGLDQRLAGDAPARVGRQDRIEHGIGDLVGDLVRVAFGNRFGGERETLAHDVKSLQVRGQNSAGIVRAIRRA